MTEERKTIDLTGLGQLLKADLGAALWATWGITYRADGSPLGPELFGANGASLGRWRAEDAGREFLGWGDL